MRKPTILMMWPPAAGGRSSMSITPDERIVLQCLRLAAERQSHSDRPTGPFLGFSEADPAKDGPDKFNQVLRVNAARGHGQRALLSPPISRGFRLCPSSGSSRSWSRSLLAVSTRLKPCHWRRRDPAFDRLSRFRTDDHATAPPELRVRVACGEMMQSHVGDLVSDVRPDFAAAQADASGGRTRSPPTAVRRPRGPPSDRTRG